MNKTTKGKTSAIGTLALTLLLGIGGGYLLWGGGASEVDTAMETEMAEHEHEEAPEFWTCSMHPQIKLPGPGQCPLCSMDLIPVAPGTSEGGLRRLTIRPEQRALMRIRTVPVERRFPTAELRLVGKVTYDETRLGYITAWVPGRIDDLFVDFTGVTVSKGDHMVKLYSPELYTAQQELLQAKASLVELAKSSIPSLYESAKGTVDSARDRLRLWGLTLDQISAMEERGKPDEHVTIYSPSSGLVVHRNAQEGMYVQTGTRIFTIADLSHVWVQLDAYESDLEWLRYGQEVSFETEAYNGVPFTGRISFIDPVLDLKTRTIRVRVNVQNEDELLKPGMFVRTVVSANIATGGKVMDPSLAGKWISPMHPEIVKDGPGKCDVCDMDLVPAEELGYVAANRASLEAPLVVPVSATLLTGTRAIVYVEVPDTDEPTYEGREVVLGPRAGNEYVIRHGLKEGELVVADGNFKIDSALQIQARPSMMNPSGGQSSGGHNHGDSGAKEMDMEPDEMSMTADQMSKPGLSDAAQARLQYLERLYADTTKSVAAGDLGRAQSAFSEIGEAVDGTDMALFTGESHTMWMELGMRLSNDAFEGKTAVDLEGTIVSLKKLEETIGMMRKHFGSLPEVSQDSGAAIASETAAKLEAVWGHYNELHKALAGDDLGAAKNAMTSIHKAMGKVGKPDIPEVGKQPWQSLHVSLAKALKEVEDTEDIEVARAEFEHISIAVEAALRVLGSTTSMRVMHCPMAFDGRGAKWLQSSEELKNPFYGSSMLGCGSTTEVLKPRETSDEE